MAEKKNEPAAGERIAKVIARAGLASRREAETWIATGRVALNGKPITSPAVNVSDQDRVTIDGQALPARERTRLFLYHKPRGLVTTHVDPQDRPTIFAALPKHLPRLISVGRLDLNTEGLLLLTNDGGLARALELPQTAWLRRYRVRAHGRVTQDRLDALRKGVTIDGIRYGPIEATLERAVGSNVWLTFAIREGKNREVRNVLGHLGLKVARLIRVSFGPFQLGELPVGVVEEVKTRHLREQLGDRLAELAGSDFSAPVSERTPESEASPPRKPLAPTPPPAHTARAPTGEGGFSRSEKPRGGRPQGKGKRVPSGALDATRPGKRGRDKDSESAGTSRPFKKRERAGPSGGSSDRPATGRVRRVRRRYHGKRER